MTPEQFKALLTATVPQVGVITLSDLEDKSKRTLLLGCTYDRKTQHVYIKDGAIHSVTYDAANYPPERVVVLNNHCFVPHKVYPTRSDFEFCQTLILRGVPLSLTGYDPNELNRPLLDGLYYGNTL